jgi:hypothetical protein
MVHAHALLTLLAQEGPAHKTLWNPTIIGVLVVLSAVGLFCGSAYLLLATNLGARLGFLVAAAGLTGFLVLLNTLWLTSATPVDPPHGRSAKWDVLEVVPEIGASKIPEVRAIADRGTPVTTEILANLRPAIDAALVTAQKVGEVEPPPQKFAQFAASTDYLASFKGSTSFVAGGGTNRLFWHHPKYAVVEICEALPVVIVPGQTPPAPTCPSGIPAAPTVSPWRATSGASPIPPAGAYSLTNDSAVGVTDSTCVPMAGWSLSSV